jgi:hypothetical protein
MAKLFLTLLAAVVLVGESIFERCCSDHRLRPVPLEGNTGKMSAKITGGLEAQSASA